MFKNRIQSYLFTLAWKEYFSPPSLISSTPSPGMSGKLLRCYKRAVLQSPGPNLSRCFCCSVNSRTYTTVVGKHTHTPKTCLCVCRDESRCNGRKRNIGILRYHTNHWNSKSSFIYNTFLQKNINGHSTHRIHSVQFDVSSRVCVGGGGDFV